MGNSPLDPSYQMSISLDWNITCVVVECLGSTECVANVFPKFC
jgi:hypothetical protein